MPCCGCGCFWSVVCATLVYCCFRSCISSSPSPKVNRQSDSTKHFREVYYPTNHVQRYYHEVEKAIPKPTSPPAHVHPIPKPVCATTTKQATVRPQTKDFSKPTNLPAYVHPIPKHIWVTTINQEKVRPQIEDFLSRILRWDPKWLEVDQELHAALPIVNKENKLIAMPTSYKSFDQYYDTIEPLLAIETWYSIARDYEEMKEDTKCKVFSVIPFSIESTKTFRNSQVSILNLEMLISEDDLEREAHPFKGDLLLFHSFSKAFAYVTELRKSVIRPKTIFNRDLLEIVGKPHTLISITMMTKELDSTAVTLHQIYKVEKIANIGSDIRKAEAFQQLYKSPFMNMILDPKIGDYLLPSASNRNAFRQVTKKCLNSKQLEALIRVTNAHKQMIPKICLIQGPPGTGKSTVIVSLIMQLLHDPNRPYGLKKFRILVCAPSNAAVDAIVVKLLEIRRASDVKHHFSLVRVGRIEKMHPEAKTVSLVVQSRKNDNKLCSSHCEKCEPRLDTSATPREEKNRLLKNTEVIASTLSSSYTHSTQTALSEQDDIVCIVDEASQCTEPESLIPLMLGIRVLILVGDPKQLPATVLSKEVKNLGLDQSLFARIDTVFKDTPINPIIQLDVQYRMSVPIALFPNNYFYGGMLKNAANVPELPFHSYRVFNHNSAQDNERLSNSGEADFVAKLLHAMDVQISDKNNTTVKLPITVGIITGYQLQKAQLMEKIKRRIPRGKDKMKIDYDVNTVDSFQGQERDIIIMSCVRSHGIGFLDDPHRLCVALTRAKHSLFICGNFKTFEKDRMWNALLTDAKSRGVYVNVNARTSREKIEQQIIPKTKPDIEETEKLNQPEVSVQSSRRKQAGKCRRRRRRYSSK